MCKEHITAIKQVLKNNRSGSIPILHCLEHSNGTLKATDLSVMVEIKTPTIADGIWKSEALDYGFKEDTKEGQWTIDDFPTLDTPKLKQSVELTGEDLSKIIRAMDFTSTDLTRPALTGVALSEGSVYGCDGYRLYRNEMSHKIDDTIILPKECIKVLKAVKADKKSWTLDIYEDTEIAFKSSGFALHSRLIDAVAPMYDQVIGNGDYGYVLAVDLKQIVDKKNKCIMVDKNDLSVYISDRDDKTKRIKLEDKVANVLRDKGNVGRYGHKEVVMPLHDPEDLRIDLAMLKQYKGMLVLRFTEKHTLPVYVDEVK